MWLLGHLTIIPLKSLPFFLNYLFDSSVVLISSVSGFDPNTTIAAGPMPASAWHEPVEFWISHFRKILFSPHLNYDVRFKIFPSSKVRCFIFPWIPSSYLTTMELKLQMLLNSLIHVGLTYQHKSYQTNINM